MLLQNQYKHFLRFFLVFTLTISMFACHDCDDESISSKKQDCLETIMDDLNGIPEGTFDQFNFGEYPMVMKV